jgi:hypothetical protein
MMTEKNNVSTKKPSVTSERTTLDLKLKQYSKIEKKGSRGSAKNEDVGGYNPIHTDTSPFISKKKSGMSFY